MSARPSPSQRPGWRTVEDSGQALGGEAVAAGDDMTVEVEGRGDAAVVEATGDNGDRYTKVKHPGGHEVPEIVQDNAGWSW